MVDVSSTWWNHNTHYHSLVLREVRSHTTSALDVGSGDGLLTRELAEVVPHVVGIDLDPSVVDRARGWDARQEWIIGDVLTYPLPHEGFDLVASIATVHHLPDLASALGRLKNLVAPGGILIVIGCARSRTLTDYLWDGLGAVQHHIFSRTRGYWEHTAPVRMEFPHTYAEVSSLAAEQLPGAQWRRLPLFRYALRWRKLQVH